MTYLSTCMKNIWGEWNWGRNEYGMWGETTRIGNSGETTRGETTRGETSWGETSCYPTKHRKCIRNVFDLHLNLNSLLVKCQIDNPSPGAVTGGN